MKVVKFLIIACAFVACVFAETRERSFLSGLHSTVGVSSGYGGAYGGYGDYNKYGNTAGVYGGGYGSGYSSYGSYGGYFEAPSVISVGKVVDETQVVNVRKMETLPRVVAINKLVIAPSPSVGYIGYGSGVSSGFSIFSNHPGRAANPGYGFGYASGWW